MGECDKSNFESVVFSFVLGEPTRHKDFILKQRVMNTLM